MNDKQKTALVFVAVIVAIMIFVHFRPKPAAPVSPVVAGNSNDAFYAPYHWNSGIFPESEGFVNNITVNAQLPGIGMISQGYMPTFGFVGMVGVKA